jgi:TRAP-type C4-dicarboxylate transport system permease small subunit
MTGILRKIDQYLQAVLRFISLVFFSALGILMIANVLLRLIGDLINFLVVKGYSNIAEIIKDILPITSFHWFDEIVEFFFASLVFYGAAALWGAKRHFSVGDWISQRLPGEKSKVVYQIFICLISTTFMGIFFWFSLRLTLRSTEVTTVFQIPKSILYSSMPISSFIMLSYSVCDVFGELRRLLVRSDSLGPE